MTEHGKTWAIVLAAGDGTRLRSITTDHHGVTTPKQFCSLRRGRTLLDEALERAARITRKERIVAVVASQHKRWWSEPLESLPSENVIVQPSNRGTAPGILLPLLAILERDPLARIIVLPSDHFVASEAVLARSIKTALKSLTDRPGEIVLLGITPDAAEPDYGWIVPRPDAGGPLAPVAAFVEKPDAAAAERLLAAGGSWNSFIFAATGPALLRLFERRLPFLLSAFRRAPISYSLAALYDSILAADFSRMLLQGSEESLRLLQVPACGWTDLGTPERVAQVLNGLPQRERHRASRVREPESRRVSLSEALFAASA